MRKQIQQGHSFNPEEIIFAATDKCNLKCSHCYVKRNNFLLCAEDSINFLKSSSNISKIGFSGGEPFLNISYMEEIIKFASQNDFLFDRIMTNGDWWKDEDELEASLKRIYDAGFDGTFGLSFDSYHNQNIDRLCCFCEKAVGIWNNPSVIEIQFVMNEQKSDLILLKDLADTLNCPLKKVFFNKKTGGTYLLEKEDVFIKVQITPLCFSCDNPKAWQDKKWFKEDFCEGPGQILYVHPNGNIAPCCGFANECEKLIIGNIKQDFETVMKNAADNKMIDICYNSGLLNFLKEKQKQGMKFQGKTSDNCTFCEYVAKNLV